MLRINVWMRYLELNSYEQPASKAGFCIRFLQEVRMLSVIILAGCLVSVVLAFIVCVILFFD